VSIQTEVLSTTEVNIRVELVDPTSSYVCYIDHDLEQNVSCDSMIEDPARVKVHLLSGLSPETSYFYKVIAGEGISGLFSFTTSGNLPTAISPAPSGSVEDPTLISTTESSATSSTSRIATTTTTLVQAKAPEVEMLEVNGRFWGQESISRLDGVHELSFSVVPGLSDLDTLIGLSDGPATKYQDLAIIIRFNTEGLVDARDGGAYRADSQFEYQPGKSYQVKFKMDLSSKRYSVSIIEEGSTNEILILENAAFRTEQADVASLDTITTSARGIHDFVSGIAAEDLPESESFEVQAAPANSPAETESRNFSSKSGGDIAFPNVNIDWGIDFSNSANGKYIDGLYPG